MAAITATSPVDADIEIGTTSSFGTSLMDWVTSVEVPEQTRMTGTGYTFGSDLATITAGKREPMEVVIRGLYTEGNSDAYNTVRGYFTATGGTAIYFRYSPKGAGAASRYVYTASNDGTTAGAVVVSQFQFPNVDAASADPIPFMFALMVPAFVQTTTGGSTGLGSA